MPPIPIYTDAPITPTKANGVTPQTAGTNNNSLGSALAGQTVTNGTTQPISYPAAQPGATAAGPAPTGYAARPAAAPGPHPTATRTIPVAENNGPAAPQPAARPLPPNGGGVATMTSTSAAAAIAAAAAGPPPPPAPSHVTSLPPQMDVPPPATNYAPTHSTSTATATTSSAAAPTTATTYNFGPVAPRPTSQYSAAEPAQSHPPGYVQDPFSQEMSAAQRASLEAQEAVDGGRGRNSFSALIGGDDGLGRGDEGVGGVWGAVKGFASVAGQKAVELEDSAWKRVNGK
ncbi:hypothetical protein AAFC00_004726 [Neodothiora populina]|uniref:Uncharacterized protein n=1 Tax=Neodothiora populina TaxID=2781224 RepID=A0ABR3P3E7_9PEZI